MYINPKQPKPEQEFPQLRTNRPKYVRSRKMTQEELDRLSRDYVLEHEGLTILSWDYVVENGKMFGESLWWDRCYGYYICDFTGEEDVYFTGLAYDIYKNGNLQFYRYYENGLEEGIETEFYPSGILKSYAVIYNENRIALAYEWDENGMIRSYIDGQQGFRVDEEGYMLIQVNV